MQHCDQSGGREYRKYASSIMVENKLKSVPIIWPVHLRKRGKVTLRRQAYDIGHDVN